ncbi:hypothetical protein [Agrobacterium deltaense]|uniref:hypothetical protein n=1 Tax=Agrobacterium deltaense TaxID=1183412 RepID=UPI001C6EBFE1|nr:hypothetical protein [Agrobacterium deltaense]MBW9074947.1 hypothetical protein [Agrobacterium deltaense]
MHDAPGMVADTSETGLTAAVLTMDGTRRTAEFFSVTGMDVANAELIVVPLNHPDSKPSRLPLYATHRDETGLPSHMVCKTPQLAWEYAKMHGHKVKACISEAA